MKILAAALLGLTASTVSAKPTMIGEAIISDMQGIRISINNRNELFSLDGFGNRAFKMVMLSDNTAFVYNSVSATEPHAACIALTPDFYSCVGGYATETYIFDRREGRVHLVRAYHDNSKPVLEGTLSATGNLIVYEAM